MKIDHEKNEKWESEEERHLPSTSPTSSQDYEMNTAAKQQQQQPEEQEHQEVMEAAAAATQAQEGAGSASSSSSSEQQVAASSAPVSSSAHLSLFSQYNVEEEVCEIWLDHPGAGIQALLDELILRRNNLRQQQQQQLLQQNGVSSANDRMPAAPTKKRVQQAKALIPYRRIIDDTVCDASSSSLFDKHHDFVQQALERRNKYKANKQWQEVNRITDGLQAMGIAIDDRYKTWRVTAVASVPRKDEEIATYSTLRLFNENKGGIADASTTTTTAGTAAATMITCEMCGRTFASRNLIFKHLRDVTSGCGTSIWAQGPSVELVEPPSVEKKLARRERIRQEKLERNQRRSRAAIAKAKSRDANKLPTLQQQAAVAAAVAAVSAAAGAAAGGDIEASLWIGDLPLAWTKPSLVKNKGGSSNYKRLSELLYRYNLPNTPLPWIKLVVRKAYHCKKEQHNSTPDAVASPCTVAAAAPFIVVKKQEHHQHQQNGRRSTAGARGAEDGRSDHQHRPYLGYAIVVYRSAGEAAAARKHLDGLMVSMETAFQDKDSSDDLSLPSFTLVVRPAKKSSTNNSNNDNSYSSPCANDNNKNGDTTNAMYLGIPSSGLDPPMADQLQPLMDDELRHRVLALKRKQRRESVTRGNAEQKDSTNHQHDIVDDPEPMNDNEIASMLKNMKHDKLVAMAVAEYQLLARAGQQPRPVRRYEGRLIPIPVRDCLLNLLENLLWPAQHQRPMLTSERYLVLVTSTSATPHFKELREACQQLMQWADPTYYYSGIAVTKNFIASPHMDERDQTFQYAVSLGNFKSNSSDGGGGELCVEGKCSKSLPKNGAYEDDTSNNDDDDDTFVNVVNTHNRIARLDGRRVHWVRTWTGGDRYSLIFYDTTDRHTTPVMEGGLDVEYLS
jgi:hypothetical protein